MAPASSLLHYQADLLLGRNRRLPIQRARSGSEKIRPPTDKNSGTRVGLDPSKPTPTPTNCCLRTLAASGPEGRWILVCGIGGNVIWLVGQGRNATGIDFSDAASELARSLASDAKAETPSHACQCRDMLGALRRKISKYPRLFPNTNHHSGETNG